MQSDKETILYKALSEVWDSALKYNSGEETPCWFDEACDICYNVSSYINHHEHMIFLDLEPLFKGWPEYSGDFEYPVPAPKGLDMTAKYAYEDSNTHEMWNLDTEYGKSRMSLLKYAMLQLMPNISVDED